MQATETRKTTPEAQTNSRTQKRSSPEACDKHTKRLPEAHKNSSPTTCNEHIQKFSQKHKKAALRLATKTNQKQTEEL